jgi:hypothetical protein
MPASKSRPVLLVGSMNLPTADDVFTLVGDRLGPLAASVPDGETGERLGWLAWQTERLRGMPEIKVIKEFKFRNPGTGVVVTAHMLAPQDGVAMADLKLGPFGYADVAIKSYERFVECKRAGRLPAETRFQVSIPNAMMFSMSFPTHRQEALEPFERALGEELGRLLEAIPHQELAIQWDVAGETQIEERRRWDADAATLVGQSWPLGETTASMARMSDLLPEEVAVGAHFCYGDPDGKHVIEPRDTSAAVALANSFCASTQRRVDWVHMPVPIDRDDDAYFAPLDELDLPAATRLYLGLIHLEDGLDGAARRINAASAHVKAFGVATECGMGRESAADIPTLLDIHRKAAERL